VIDLLQRFDLPTRLPKNFPREKILKALKFDKKFERGKIRFVVTPRIGAAFLTTDVTLEDIRDAVDAL
jgi:3-dehydroquinate synthase